MWNLIQRLLADWVSMTLYGGGFLLSVILLSPWPFVVGAALSVIIDFWDPDAGKSQKKARDS